jgi:hypothetical protein
VLLTRLRWRCSECHSARFDMVCMSKDSAVVPWWKGRRLSREEAAAS